MSFICSSFFYFRVSTLSQLQVSCLHLNLVLKVNIRYSSFWVPYLLWLETPEQPCCLCAESPPVQSSALAEFQLTANSARLFPGATWGLLAVCPEEQHTSAWSQPGMSHSPGLPWACRSWELWTDGWHLGVWSWAVWAAPAAPALCCPQANEPPSMAQNHVCGTSE